MLLDINYWRVVLTCYSIYLNQNTMDFPGNLGEAFDTLHCTCIFPCFNVAVAHISLLFCGNRWYPLNKFVVHNSRGKEKGALCVFEPVCFNTVRLYKSKNKVEGSL